MIEYRSVYIDLLIKLRREYSVGNFLVIRMMGTIKWVIFIGLVLSWFLDGVPGKEYDYSNDDVSNGYRNPKRYFKHEGDFCIKKRTCLPNDYMTSYPDKSCYCDETCSITNDCCQGFTPSIHQSLSPSQLSCLSYTEIMRKSVFGYLMAETCSSDFKIPEIILRCEDTIGQDDVTLKLPVTSNKTHVVYKNMYCAFCNNDYDILHWNLQILCLNDAATFIPDNSSQCDYRFWPPREIQNARQCPNRLVVDSCPNGFNTTDDLAYKCTSHGVDYVYINTTMYKNKYCAKCNSLSEEVYCEQQEFEQTSPSPTIQPRYSFRMLIDFNSNQAERQGNPSTYLPFSCSDDEIFDPYTNQCRKIYCWPPRQASEGKCLMNRNPSVSTAPGNGTDKNCTFVKYTQSEYKFINDSGVFIVPLEQVYNMTDVFIQDTYLLICANENQTCVRNCNQPQVMFDFDETGHLLFIITLIVSVVSLAATFMVYMLFPVLRNVPGKAVMCLTMSLFFAQLMFLVTKFTEIKGSACILIAVVIHFFHLSTFFWVNVIAYNLWMTFSKQFISTRPESKSSKRMFYYYIYAWGCPLLITISALVVDNVDMGSRFDSFKPHYGQYSCFISSSLALLLFFVGPATLSQLFNIVSFVFTSCHIVRANRHGATARGQANSCTLLVICKLSLVMGLTWVFALVASMVAGPVLWYLFICLNGLQGFYICICFVCTKKVIRLLKQKVVDIKQTRSLTTQMSSLKKTNNEKQYV